MNENETTPRDGDRLPLRFAECTWEEIERGEVDPGTFNLRNMPERIEAVGDLWGDLKRRGRSLKGPSEKLRSLRGG